MRYAVLLLHRPLHIQEDTGNGGSQHALKSIKNTWKQATIGLQEEEARISQNLFANLKL
jgi:hypothetical protein